MLLWGQFHQPLASSFYARRFQKLKKTVKSLLFSAHLGSAWIKAADKMLVKWTPGVNFINILRAHFVQKFFLCLEFGFEQTFIRKMRA